MKKYFTKTKSGEDVEVSQDLASQLVASGKKTHSDFEIEDVPDIPAVKADPISAPSAGIDIASTLDAAPLPSESTSTGRQQEETLRAVQSAEEMDVIKGLDPTNEADFAKLIQAKEQGGDVGQFATQAVASATPQGREAFVRDGEVVFGSQDVGTQLASTALGKENVANIQTGLSNLDIGQAGAGLFGGFITGLNLPARVLGAATGQGEVSDEDTNLLREAIKENKESFEIGTQQVKDTDAQRDALNQAKVRLAALATRNPEKKPEVDKLIGEIDEQNRSLGVRRGVELRKFNDDGWINFDKLMEQSFLSLLGDPMAYIGIGAGKVREAKGLAPTTETLGGVQAAIKKPLTSGAERAKEALASGTGVSAKEFETLTKAPGLAGKAKSAITKTPDELTASARRLDKRIAPGQDLKASDNAREAVDNFIQVNRGSELKELGTRSVVPTPAHAEMTAIESKLGSTNSDDVMTAFVEGINTGSGGDDAIVKQLQGLVRRASTLEKAEDAEKAAARLSREANQVAKRLESGETVGQEGLKTLLDIVKTSKKGDISATEIRGMITDINGKIGTQDQSKWGPTKHILNSVKTRLTDIIKSRVSEGGGNVDEFQDLLNVRQNEMATLNDIFGKGLRNASSIDRTGSINKVDDLLQSAASGNDAARNKIATLDKAIGTNYLNDVDNVIPTRKLGITSEEESLFGTIGSRAGKAKGLPGIPKTFPKDAGKATKRELVAGLADIAFGSATIGPAGAAIGASGRGPIKKMVTAFSKKNPKAIVSAYKNLNAIEATADIIVKSMLTTDVRRRAVINSLNTMTGEVRESVRSKLKREAVESEKAKSWLTDWEPTVEAIRDVVKEKTEGFKEAAKKAGGDLARESVGLVTDAVLNPNNLDVLEKTKGAIGSTSKTIQESSSGINKAFNAVLGQKFTPTITEGRKTRADKKSLHNLGMAADYRIKDIPGIKIENGFISKESMPTVRAITKKMEESNPFMETVIEDARQKKTPHIHWEYKPQYASIVNKTLSKFAEFKSKAGVWSQDKIDKARSKVVKTAINQVQKELDKGNVKLSAKVKAKDALLGIDLDVDAAISDLNVVEK